MKARFKERGYVDEQLNTALNKVFGDSRLEKAPSKSSMVCALGYSNRAQQMKFNKKIELLNMRLSHLLE